MAPCKLSYYYYFYYSTLQDRLLLHRLKPDTPSSKALCSLTPKRYLYLIIFINGSVQLFLDERMATGTTLLRCGCISSGQQVTVSLYIPLILLLVGGVAQWKNVAL